MPPPFSRSSAIARAEARASQVSAAPSASPLQRDQLNELRVEFMDEYDSRWQRDPGRANGPYS
jgi:hypothetical protein